MERIGTTWLGWDAIAGSGPLFDERTIEVTQSILPDWMAYVFAVVTQLSDAWTLVIVLALAYWFAESERVAPIFGLVFGGLALVVVIKPILAIPRPPTHAMIPPEAADQSMRSMYAWAIQAGGYTFPSGHTVGATLTWGALIGAVEIGTRRGRIAAAATLISISALSRIAIGVHYLTDVVGGIVFGLVLLFVWKVALERVNRPVELSLGAGLVCALLPVIFSAGGSEPFLAVGALGGALLAWHVISSPIPSFDPTPVGVGLGIVGVVWFVSAGFIFTSLFSGALGFLLMGAAMAVAIFTWPVAVDLAQRKLETRTTPA